jgi:hypothetical protein
LTLLFGNIRDRQQQDVAPDDIVNISNDIEIEIASDGEK